MVMNKLMVRFHYSILTLSINCLPASLKGYIFKLFELSLDNKTSAGFIYETETLSGSVH